MIDNRKLRDLSATRHRPAVTSLYLDVDGRHRPRRAEVAEAFEALARDARRVAGPNGDGGLAGSVEGDLRRVAEWLAAGYDRRAVRGLAFFSCDAVGFFEVLELPDPVEDLVVVAPTPYIRPLEGLRHEGRPVLVALVDRQHGRLLRVERGVITREERVEDPVARQVDQGVEIGGWDRQSEELTRRHLQRVADRLYELSLRRPADVALGGVEESVALLDRLLHPTVRERVATRLTLPVAAGAEEILTTAAAALGAADRRRESALVREIEERRGGHGAVCGLEDTLVALDDHRVRLLALSNGFRGRAAGCPSCGHLALGARTCPECGDAMEPLEDAAEAAIEAAVRQGAEVAMCSGEDLDALGGIAALERY